MPQLLLSFQGVFAKSKSKSRFYKQNQNKGFFAKSRPQLLGFVGLNHGMPGKELPNKLFTHLDLCVSSLRRGHANLLCLAPMLTDDPRRESRMCLFRRRSVVMSNNDDTMMMNTLLLCIYIYIYKYVGM